MWLLLRRPDHSLEIELDALADGGQILGGFPTITEARTARATQEKADKEAAARRAEEARTDRQKDLFDA